MDLPVYRPDYFLSREEELRLINEAVDRMLEGEPLPVRTFAFRCARGSGKSWLAIHLKRHTLQHEHLFPLFIGLEKNYDTIEGDEFEWYYDTYLQENAHSGEREAVSPEKVVRSIISWFSDQIGAGNARDASTSQISSWIVRAIQQPPFGPGEAYRFLALVVDSVFESDWTLLRQLEEALLAPLAELPRVLIILTGRGKLFPWYSPILRTAIDERSLEAFSDSDIERQVEQQVPGGTVPVTTIRSAGAGFPLNNVLVAQVAEGQIGWEEVLDQLLAFIETPAQRKQLRAAIEALCVLEGYREDEIAEMMLAYMWAIEHDRPRVVEWSIEKTRELKQTLVDRNIARWRRGMFVIDESIRPMFEYYLRHVQPMLYCLLNKRAYELYTDWATQFGGDYYAMLAQHHLAALGGAPATINCEEWRPTETAMLPAKGGAV